MTQQPRFNNPRIPNSDIVASITIELGERHQKLIDIESKINNTLNSKHLLYDEDEVEEYLGFYIIFIREIDQIDSPNLARWFARAIDRLNTIHSDIIPPRFKTIASEIFKIHPEYENKKS